MKINTKIIDFIIAVLLSPFIIFALFLVCLSGTLLYLISPIKFWLAYPEVADEVSEIVNEWVNELCFK